MTEQELIQLWNMNRKQIITAQFAPTFLLTASIALLQFGLIETGWLIKFAALGILLASGILGALSQYSAATESIAVAKDLAALPATSAIGKQIISLAPWQNVVRFVTPAVFTAIFVLIFAALHGF